MGENSLRFLLMEGSIRLRIRVLVCGNSALAFLPRVSPFLFPAHTLHPPLQGGQMDPLKNSNWIDGAWHEGAKGRTHGAT